MNLSAENSSWLESVCPELGMPDCAEAAAAGALAFEDLVVGFSSPISGEGEQVAIQIPLGRLPQGGEPILRRVLELQHLLAGPASPVFGLAPGGDVLMVTSVVDTDEIEAAEGAMIVKTLVRLSRHWREVLGSDSAPAVNFADAGPHAGAGATRGGF